MKLLSHEDATSVVNWLNIHAPFSEIALFHKRIPNDEISLLSWKKMNYWVVNKKWDVWEKKDEYRVGYKIKPSIKSRMKIDDRMKRIYTPLEMESIEEYEKSKGSTLNAKEFQKKYLQPKDVSWKDIVLFLEWKFDLTDYESDELFRDILFQRASGLDDMILNYTQSDQCFSELPEKLMAYQQREIDYQYIPGGKLYKRAQLDYNVTKKGVDDFDFQPRRSPEELGPYRLEEKTIYLAISCIQRFFGNNRDMAFEMIKKHLLKDNEEYPMLIAVLEKYEITLAEYLTQVVINAVGV
uniref:Uncharacterized protein n=1 Tax=viral metagenome TaxID=1070528 RepID=A0A6C0K3V2_9ZZZZ